jgi:hypothetical protein
MRWLAVAVLVSITATLIMAVVALISGAINKAILMVVIANLGLNILHIEVVSK